MITVDFQRLAVKPGDRILDIGCGSGRHTTAAYALQHVTAIGADACVDDLSAACQRLNLHDRLGAHGGGCWALSGADITCLPFGNACFDVVVCSEVLEHIADDRRAVAEIIRVLKPGGHLVVSVPRRWPETVCWALSRQYRHTEGGHVRIYSKPQIVQRIQQQGPVLWSSHYAHGLHSPYWWLKCLVGPDRNDLWPVAAYHRLLTWDMMEKPRLTRRLEALANPIMGKSLVLYFRK